MNYTCINLALTQSFLEYPDVFGQHNQRERINKEELLIGKWNNLSKIVSRAVIITFFVASFLHATISSIWDLIPVPQMLEIK